jgi:MFS transporter, DHA2 family, methylenomycin A resistance protein
MFRSSHNEMSSFSVEGMTRQTQQRLILSATSLATFMAILDTSVVNLGLHAIRAALRADVASLQWVVDAYNVAYAAAILSGGVLGDRLGRRRIFVAGAALFGIASVACSLAPGIAALVVARGVAGLGAALLLPTSLAILNVTFDGRARARAIALWASANGLAMAVGPTVGGLLVSDLGWRSLFGLVVPFAIACGLLAAFAVDETRGAPEERLDGVGQLLAALALVALCLALIEGPRWGWASAPGLVATAVFLIAATGFVQWERRTAAPMVPLALFRSAPLSAAVADAPLMTFGFYAFLFVFPLYLQARGASALHAGVVLLPLSLTFFAVSSMATGRLVNRVGPRVVVGVGMLLVAVGLLGASWLGSGTDDVAFAPALLSIGAGFGLITGPISGVAVASAPRERSGVASGLVKVARMVGATVSVALIGAWFGGRELPREPLALGLGLRRALAVAALAEALGAVIAWRHLRRDSLGEPRPSSYRTGFRRVRTARE